MQATILTAGRGERLRPITDHVPKSLIPFWGKPFISYLLDNLEGLVDEVLVVIGEREAIREQLGDSHGRMTLHYVRQPRSLGTGDAVLQTRGLLDEPFLVLLGDTCPPRQTIAEIIEAPGDAVLTLIQVGDPQNHLGVNLRNGLVVEALWTGAALVDAGMFRFSSDIYAALDGLPPRGKELRVLQGVHQMLQEGKAVRAVQMDPPWLQFGDHEGVAGVLRVMRELRPQQAAEAPGDSSVDIATRGCRIENSLVFGPGELVDCKVKDSLVYCATRLVGKSVTGKQIAWV